jgi:hypothetical protein
VAAQSRYVVGSDGAVIPPPGDERTVEPIKKMNALASNMESIVMNFRQGNGPGVSIN